MPAVAALSGLGRNLRPYQFQIGEVIFGRHTPYPVEKVDISSYTVNNQDFQVPMSNETRMGIDTKQAGPMTFTLGVIDNAPVSRSVVGLPDDLVAKSSKLLTALQTEWKANAATKQYGEMQPLIYCDGYGAVRRIYGRPRKFTYTRKSPKSLFYRVTAEYARADTLTYSDVEYAAALTQGADLVEYSQLGDADSWLRVLLTGPMTNPVIQVGDSTIQLQIEIDEGMLVELSSYPWARRIVSAPADGGPLINQRRAMVGQTRYLDQIMMPAGLPVGMSYVAADTTTASGCLVLWRDAHNVV
ncbi:hypothetical protein [Mycolicibacter heraklionensis]|nr:hypothetical protein [Mycolicibacter heraklionensis]